MKKEQLELRVSQLEAALQQSAAQHNVLAGQLNECKTWLEQMEKEELESLPKDSDMADDGYIPNCA